MRENSNFWVKRFRRYGHTGWANQAVYYYDQAVRLRLVEGIIKNLRLPNKFNCLDWGCGVGDFSRMLAGAGARVVGYDVAEEIVGCAQQRSHDHKIVYTSSVAEAFGRAPFDLVLSVTVLQHIVQDEILQSVITDLCENVSSGGYLVAIETTGEPSTVVGSHVKLRTRQMWAQCFVSVGMKLVDSRYIYHPNLCPTDTYRRYISNWKVKLLHLATLLRVPLAGPLLERVARNASVIDEDYFSTTPSPTLLMVWQRQ